MSLSASPIVCPDELLREVFALRPEICRWLRRWTCVDADREDICQEVLRACTNRIHVYDPNRAELRTWVYLQTARVAARLVPRLRRQAGAFPQDADTDDLEGVPSSYPSPESITASTESLEKLLAKFEGMDDRLLSVMIAHDLQGLKHVEIAKAFGIPVGTSKSRLSAAHAEARRRIGDERDQFRGVLPFLWADDTIRAAGSGGNAPRNVERLSWGLGGLVVGLAMATTVFLVLPPRLLLHATTATRPIDLHICDVPPSPAPAPTTAGLPATVTPPNTAPRVSPSLINRYMGTADGQTR